MVLFGYSIEDNADDGQFDIYRFRLTPGTPPQRTGGLRASGTNQDLEGLGTRGSGASAVIAISEGSGDDGVLVRGVDAGPPPLSNRVNLSGSNRVFSETGFDFTTSGVGYVIQGSVDNNRSQLYRVRNVDTSSPDVSPVGGRKNEFADGLAIANNNSIGWISDFYTEDGDANQIQRINLNTGAITLTSRIVTPNGGNLGLNRDSGLAFTPNGQHLYALVENNDANASVDARIYRITNFKNDDGRPGTLDNTAIATFVRPINISSLPAGDRGEFEGLAIINEPTTPSRSSPIAGVNDFGADSEEIKPLETASVQSLLGSANPSQPESVDAAAIAAVIPTDDLAGV